MDLIFRFVEVVLQFSEDLEALQQELVQVCGTGEHAEDTH
jgi:hypothetical protein